LTLGFRPTWTEPYRYVFSPDKHVGFERVNGVTQPMHNMRAIGAMLEFARDFKPHGWVEGGDQLDLGVIGHWNKTKKLSLEGLRVQKDLNIYGTEVMAPVEEIGPVDLWWLMGNHEEWLNQLADENPGLAELLDIRQLLHLEDRGWTYIPQGHYIDLGRLRFLHGDTISGGDNVAKNAVVEHNKNIRFGHFHTYQTYTKHSPVDAAVTKSGVAVPGLTNRGPAYGKNRANKWQLGFNYGYIFPDGSYTDYTPIIIDGKFAANGRVYRG
jgi:hypothetical protein